MSAKKKKKNTWVCINKICIFLESYPRCIFQIKAGLSDLNKSLALQENSPGTPRQA